MVIKDSRDRGDVTTCSCECGEPFCVCLANPLKAPVASAFLSTRATKEKRKGSRDTESGILTAMASKFPHPQTLHQIPEYARKE